ncbi:MAG: VCBS repeat-containing protein [Zavarzinella sp.]
MKQVLILLLPCILLGWAAPQAHAYVEIAMPLSSVIQQSVVIATVQITKVDKAKKIIVYRKIKDLKGKHPQDEIRHVLEGELKPGEIKAILDWAEVGKIAVFFHNGSASEMCIDMNWYQAYPRGDYWGMSHGEPFLLRSYAGKADRLPALITTLLAGNEALVPCMEDNKELIAKRTARIMRMKNSMKNLDWNIKRDFVGWGADDIRRIEGVPGFSHLAPLGNFGGTVLGIYPCDFNLDGKQDFCILTTTKVALFQHQGDSFAEVVLPDLTTASAVCWGDYNADGYHDLALATSTGVRLFTNLQNGQFRDDSALIEDSMKCLSGVVIRDFTGDGKADILASSCFGGVALYENRLPADAVKQLTPPQLGEWWHIGPFDNTGGKGFDAVYPPEQQIDFTQTMMGKGNRKVSWTKSEFKDGQINNLAIFNDPNLNNDATVYVAREITCVGIAEIPLSLGSDDGLAVFVNGKRVLAENTNRACLPDQNQLTIRLRPGKNHLLLKITQGNGDFAFYCQPGQAKLSAAGWFQDVSAAWGVGPRGLGNQTAIKQLKTIDWFENNQPQAILVNNQPKDSLMLQARKPFQQTPLPEWLQTTGQVACFSDRGKLQYSCFQQQTMRIVQADLEKKQLQPLPDKLPANALTHAHHITWGDLNGDGLADCYVGCVLAPNRLFLQQPDGTFQDESLALGVTQRTWNSQVVATTDLNQDGRPDMLLGNSGQDSVALFSQIPTTKDRTPISIHFSANRLGQISRCELVNLQTKETHRLTAIACNGQPATLVCTTVTPGKYRVQLLGDQEPFEQTFDVADQHTNVVLYQRKTAPPASLPSTTSSK